VWTENCRDALYPGRIQGEGGIEKILKEGDGVLTKEITLENNPRKSKKKSQHFQTCNLKNSNGS
jgi:hypothetical protein